MSQSLVQVKVHKPLGTIVLNRPQRKNAISRQLLDEFSQALTDLYQQKSVRAVVLAGAGSDFCAGSDLYEIHATNQDDKALAQWRCDVLQLRDVLIQMLEFPKPIIATVSGSALATGAALMLACDLVLASPNAQFGLPEPRRGLVAGAAAPLLTFRVGGSHATRLLISAESIDATEAHRIGLFHEILPEEQLWARANEIAGQTTQSAAEAIQLTRRMLYETIGEQITTLLTACAAMDATARTTEAAAEGVAAFLEKREPNWP
jgi:methylglutaconyl-CoA hydratase